MGSVTGTRILAWLRCAKDNCALSATPGHSRLLALSCWLAVLSANPAVSQQFTPPEEIKKKSEIFQKTPSFDVTPTTVTVGAVTYSIPRNYFTVLPPAIPTIKITFPEFKPLSEETRECFNPKRVRSSDCATIEFRILGGSAPGSHSLTHAQNLESYLKNSPRARKTRVLDYDVYELGPENARSETYSNRTHDLFFHCAGDFIKRPQERIVCDDNFRLDDRNHAQFFFPRAWIGRVAEIEAGIRRLVASFVKTETQK